MPSSVSAISNYHARIEMINKETVRYIGIVYIRKRMRMPDEINDKRSFIYMYATT